MSPPVLKPPRSSYFKQVFENLPRVRSAALFYTNTPLLDRSIFTTAALPYVLILGVRANIYTNDILVWGELVVYTSPNEAKGTLEADEVDEQYMHLI